MRRVGAINVKSGVGFGIAQRLSLSQNLIKGAPLGAHLREDKVPRAVDNARHLSDLITCHRLAHGFNDRYATGHRSLKPDLHPRRFRQCDQLIAMLSNQGLVGRHNMFAVLDRALYQIVSRTGASNQLYQHIDFRIFSQSHHITADAGVAVVMVGVLPARTNVNQFHRLSRASL